MTPLAIIAKEAGMNVSGSDIDATFITDNALKKKDIHVFENFNAAHIHDIDLVITTVAHNGLKNPEVIAAKEKGIPVWTQAEAVGTFMKGKIFGKSFTGISITGTHGKTTTTSMIATMLQQIGGEFDPSYVIGTSEIPSLSQGLPGHLGKGNYFVAEADEYAGEYEENGETKKQTRFLWQHPEYLIMTSLEFDHPDVYASIEDIEKSFLQFAKQLSQEAVLIYNGDDIRLQKIASQINCKKVSYGFGDAHDFVLLKNQIQEGSSGVHFSVSYQQQQYDFDMQVNGVHNALNATAVVAVGQSLGLSFTQIHQGLRHFQGSKRRLEKIIPTNPNLPIEPIYYDDYAHHPTEIKASLEALHSLYPNQKIVCIFQPHTYSRTKALFNEFAGAFDDADEVILTDIFASAREKQDPSVSSRQLAQAMKKTKNEVSYLPMLSDVVKYLHSRLYPADTVIITMGAGDVYTILSEK